MNWSCLLLLFSSIAVAQCTTSKSTSRNDVRNLYPGEVSHCCSSVQSRDLQMYCYGGRPKHVLHMWNTVVLKINSVSDNFEIYDGGSPESVQVAYEQHRSSWNLNMLWGPLKAREIKLSPFNRTCIGISSNSDYSVQLHVIRVDYWRVLLLLSGLILFMSAPRLCENPLFYYICGISCGMAASVLFLLYMIGRLFPRKPMMYGFVFGGWAVVVYLIQLLWDNLRTVLVDYRLYVVYYVCITGLVSFIICYRIGPVTDKRSKNLIKWSLQGMSSIMVMCSSHFLEAAVGIVLILILFHNFRKPLVSEAKSIWKRRFPPKVRLLTEDEYHEQGVRETQKALDELRGYCSSPDCNQWKTVLRLKNPVRFASFIEGTSHLNDNEVLEYETATPRELSFTDDSDSDSHSILTD